MRRHVQIFMVATKKLIDRHQLENGCSTFQSQPARAIATRFSVFLDHFFSRDHENLHVPPHAYRAAACNFFVASDKKLIDRHLIFFIEISIFWEKSENRIFQGNAFPDFIFSLKPLTVLANHSQDMPWETHDCNSGSYNENRFRTTFCSCNAQILGVFGHFFDQIWENDGFRSDDGTFSAIAFVGPFLWSLGTLRFFRILGN